MKLLVLGGTRFVGRHIVEIAISRGHDVTIFHRGKTGLDLFPDTEKLIGDRTNAGDLEALEGRQWDAVIDTCGFFPADVLRSAEILKSCVDRYLFISSVSVYRDFNKEGMDESGPLAVTPDPDATEITAENYGALKVLCEQAALGVFGDRATIVRPGLIVGPHDPTGRFGYWPARIAGGGEVLAPGGPRRKVQFIDARDLARFVIGCIDTSLSGTFNATGPAEPLELRSFLECCRTVVGGDATFTWVSDSFLEQAQIVPFTGLPLWIPESSDTVGWGSVDCSRAIVAGLTFTPLEQTISETFEWDRSQPSLATGQAIGADEESEILAGWHRLTQPYRA